MSRIVIFLLFFVYVSSVSTTIIQISDIHIHNSTSAGLANLKAFNTSVLKTIRPEYVIASGDLALGYQYELQSASQKRQWLYYESLWKYQKTVPQKNWLDIPGNHDYTMKELSQTERDVVKYSASSWNKKFSVIPIHKSNEHNTCLLGVDFTYSPHVPYWLNQFGYATSAVLNEIETELNKNNCERTIAYGHYPIVLVNHEKVSSFFIHNHISLYLSGHLHNNTGSSFHMNYNNTLMDLQLPSLAYNGVFRIISITNDWISYTDEQVGTLQKQPIIHKVTPPDYETNLHQSFDKWVEYVQSLTHVTITVYRQSTHDITGASAMLDGHPLQAGYEENDLVFDTTALSLAWLIPVNKMTLTNHTLQISVSFNDDLGTHMVNRTFHFDLSSNTLSLSSQQQKAVTLFTVIEPILPIVLLFIGFVLVSLVSLLQPPQKALTQVLTNSHFSMNILLRLRYIRGNPRLYLVFLCACFSLLIGPYFAGFLDGQYFMSFIWGTLTFSSKEGFIYSHWVEMGIWGCVLFCGVVLPMFLYSLMHIQRPYLQSWFGVILYNIIQWLMVGIAVYVLYKEILLTIHNFPFSVLVWSLNVMILPVLVIGLTLVWCNQYKVANVTFMVSVVCLKHNVNLFDEMKRK